MPIVQSGTINTTALIVPDLYVQIVSPQTLLLNGVPTNVVGMVGTAQWGPVNQPITIGNMAQYAATFGAVQNRKYDMGTQVATAVQQGAQNFVCVRVTDGTDAAATIAVLTNCITFNALYTGILGNSITVTIGTGSKASTHRVTVGIPGLRAEIFDNIDGSGNTFWVDIAAAINTGQGQLRGPSNYITATAGVGTTAPSNTSYTLAGGSDGVTTITSAVLVGLDTTPRKGMYVLRNQGCSIGVLSDADDSTQWSAIDTFGLAEGIWMIQVIAAGTALATMVTTKNSAGLDSWNSKLMAGDWIWWNDGTNAVLRLVSPQGFVAGRYSNLSPEQSGLNKPLYGVVGSQKSGLNPLGSNTYSSAELQTLFQAGIDVIANPGAGGLSMWTMRDGNNSSSDVNINGDNYSRLTNYLSSTLAAGMGIYVGRTINAQLFQQIRSTLLSFLTNLLQQGQLGTLDGSLPFSVVCDTSNNPLSRTSLDYVQADVAVQYMGINKFFIVNLQGGQTVVIQQPNAVAR